MEGHGAFPWPCYAGSAAGSPWEGDWGTTYEMLVQSELQRQYILAMLQGFAAMPEQQLALMGRPPWLGVDADADDADGDDDDEDRGVDEEGGPDEPPSPPSFPGLSLSREPVAIDLQTLSIRDAPPARALATPRDSLHMVGPGQATAPPATAAAAGVSIERQGGVQRVHWTVNARVLKSMDKSAVSPSFDLDLPGSGVQTFRLTLYPSAKGDGKGAGSFRKAKGRGRIVLKCETQVPETAPRLAVTFLVGEGDGHQAARGPVVHSFVEHSTCGLPKATEEWDFGASVDEETKTLSVYVFCGADGEDACGAGSRPAPSPPLPPVGGGARELGE